MAEPSDRLPIRILLAFGLPGFPLAALLVPLYIYLPAFYADEMGLGLAAVGWILLAARLWDVVVDPAVGVWVLPDGLAGCTIAVTP